MLTNPNLHSSALVDVFEKCVGHRHLYAQPGLTSGAIYIDITSIMHSRGSLKALADHPIYHLHVRMFSFHKAPLHKPARCQRTRKAKEKPSAFFKDSGA